MVQNFEFFNLILIISSLLGVSANQVTSESTPSDFDLWDSVMQVEIIAQLEGELPGLLSFSPELPSKTSVSEIWKEIERYMNH